MLLLRRCIIYRPEPWLELQGVLKGTVPPDHDHPPPLVNFLQKMFSDKVNDFFVTNIRHCIKRPPPPVQG